MPLTTGSGLPARLRDSPRARYLTAGSLVVISTVSVPMFSGVFSPGHRVLAAETDLPAGHVLSRTDFSVVDADAPASSVISDAELAHVIGQTLRVEVPKGVLFAAGDLGAFPPTGMAQVAMKVDPGQFPPGLRAGQQVAVMPPTASAASTTQASPLVPPDAPVVGEVVSIAPDPDTDSGGSVVELLVKAGSADAVTAAEGGSLVGLDANGDLS